MMNYNAFIVNAMMQIC